MLKPARLSSSCTITSPQVISTKVRGLSTYLLSLSVSVFLHTVPPYHLTVSWAVIIAYIRLIKFLVDYLVQFLPVKSELNIHT